MSEVNADGVLLNPHEAILQEVQALTNSLTAEEPEGMEDDKARPVQAGNGQPAGEVGGAPHVSVSGPGGPGPQGGGHRQLRRGAPAPAGQKAGPARREHEKTKAGSPRDSGGAGTAKTDD